MSSSRLMACIVSLAGGRREKHRAVGERCSSTSMQCSTSTACTSREVVRVPYYARKRNQVFERVFLADAPSFSTRCVVSFVMNGIITHKRTCTGFLRGA